MPSFEELLRQLQEQHERELRDLRVQLEQKLHRQLQSHHHHAGSHALDSTDLDAGDSKLVLNTEEDMAVSSLPVLHQVQNQGEAEVVDTYFSQQLLGANTAEASSGFGHSEFDVQTDKERIERRPADLSQQACRATISGNSSEKEACQRELRSCNPTFVQSAQRHRGTSDGASQVRLRSEHNSLRAGLTAKICFRRWSDCVWPSFPDISAIQRLHEELDRSANRGTPTSENEHDETREQNDLDHEFVLGNPPQAPGYIAAVADDWGFLSIGTKTHGTDCVPCKWQKRIGGCLHGKLCHMCHSSDHDHLSYGKRNKIAKLKFARVEAVTADT